MPPRIIVGVDFSPEAELAARQAIEIARHSGGEVFLIRCTHAVELPEVREDGTPAERDAARVYRAGLASRLAADREQLAALHHRLSGQGPTVSQMLSEGFPEEALCRAAAELDGDLVVVGTHGRTGFEWFALGSIAERAVRLCPVDVLVARREAAGRGGFRRILVATDFSPAADRALDQALQLAASDAQVDLVHYLGTRLPAEPYAGFLVAPSATLADRLYLELTSSARERGANLVDSRRRPGVDLRFHALPGRPIPSIVHRLEESTYDLAALGSHGRRGFRRLLLGSAAEAVVRRAPCSVLVAHAAPNPCRP